MSVVHRVGGLQPVILRGGEAGAKRFRSRHAGPRIMSGVRL